MSFFIEVDFIIPIFSTFYWFFKLNSQSNIKFNNNYHLLYNSI